MKYKHWKVPKFILNQLFHNEATMHMPLKLAFSYMDPWRALISSPK